MAQQDAKARQTQHLPSQARSPIGTLRYFPLPWRTKGRRLTTRYAMEQIVNLHIERLPEGVYLATSDDIPGLAAQGRTLPPRPWRLPATSPRSCWSPRGTPGATQAQGNGGLVRLSAGGERRQLARTKQKFIMEMSGYRDSSSVMRRVHHANR